MVSSNQFLEILENRRLLSADVSAAVLGIQGTDILPAFIAPQTTEPPMVPGFHFVPATQSYASRPYINGNIFVGSFTTKPSTVGNSDMPSTGSLVITITSQTGNNLAGVVKFNGWDVSVLGHVNRHGNIALWNAVSGWTNVRMLLAGQIDQAGHTITNGAYQFTGTGPGPYPAVAPPVTNGLTATGHFSAVD